MRLLVTFVFVAAGFSAQFVHASAGRVDDKGCHHSKKQGQHCHGANPSAGPAVYGGESTKERDKRLKRECRGMPNAGACLGYTAR